MSCYDCNKCGNFFDSDYVGCELDPRDETELVCPDCHMELSPEEEERPLKVWAEEQSKKDTGE